MPYGKQLIKVDLGVDFDAGHCAEHTAHDADCQACVDAPEVEVKVPDFEGYWVEMRNPRTLAYGERKRLYEELPDGASPAERQARLDRIVTGLITAWNLVPANPDAGEDPEAVLQLPKDDPRALDRAPAIISSLFGALGRAAREPAVPKASVT